MLTRAHSLLSPDIERAAEASIGCAIEVHRRLGPGFLEVVYRDALKIELGHAGLSVETEVPVMLTYRDQPLRQHRLDLVVERSVILELKAVERLDRIHQAQLISYLRAANLRLGLLINFNVEVLKAGIRRVVL